MDISQGTSAYRVLIVTADRFATGQARIDPELTTPDLNEASRFASRFNELELENPRGMWAVVSRV